MQSDAIIGLHQCSPEGVDLSYSFGGERVPELREIRMKSGIWLDELDPVKVGCSIWTSDVRTQDLTPTPLVLEVDPPLAMVRRDCEREVNVE